MLPTPNIDRPKEKHYILYVYDRYVRKNKNTFAEVQFCICAEIDQFA